MTVKKKVCKSCGYNMFITAFPFKEDNYFERQDVCRVCAKKVTTRTCKKCGEKKDITEFPYISRNHKPRLICKDCFAPIKREVRKAIENRKVYCRYTYENCSWSDNEQLCCYECPMIEYCPDRCDSKPLAEPNGCGCVEK